ncbi:hypothetical protein [Peterkaempfera bronchialis]|uniref:hypothetical protein n=1 Tax=Peterkaempfera bronchialis TaxID=2126346 RepID=UPI003C2ECB61
MRTRHDRRIPPAAMAAALLALATTAGCGTAPPPAAPAPPTPPPGARTVDLAPPDCTPPGPNRPATASLPAHGDPLLLEYRCDRTVTIPGAHTARVDTPADCTPGSSAPKDVYGGGGLATGLLPEQLLWHLFCVDRTTDRLVLGFTALHYNPGTSGLPGIRLWALPHS